MSADSDHGSFVTGFSLGLFAGAVGYFLFATDKGENVRDELKNEWKKAQEQMVAAGHDPSALSLRDLATGILQKLELINLDSKDSHSKTAKPKSSRSGKPKRPVTNFTR